MNVSIHNAPNGDIGHGVAVPVAALDRMS